MTTTVWTTEAKVARNKKNLTGHSKAKALGLRYCPKCELAKEHECFEFPVGSRVQKAWCKDCRSIKECPKCHKILPRATHYQQLKTGYKLNHAYCLDCDRLYQREWKLKSNYLMSQEEYAIMLEAQGKKCYLCKSSKKLVVDHDHNTGKVRGLLCDLCNRGLGYFKDNPDVLIAAAKYVKQVTLSV